MESAHDLEKTVTAPVTLLESWRLGRPFVTALNTEKAYG